MTSRKQLRRYYKTLVYHYLASLGSIGVLYYLIFLTQIPGLSIHYFLRNFPSFSFEWQMITIALIPCYFLALTLIVNWAGSSAVKYCLGKIASQPTSQQYQEY